MKPQLEDTVELSRNFLRAYYAGDNGPWFALLCSKSIWLGAGERVLIGGDAIRENFADFGQPRPVEIIREEYHPLPLDPRCAAVAAELTVATKARDVVVKSTFTLVYQLVGTETKLVLTHASYEFVRPIAEDMSKPMLELSAYQVVRDILLDVPETARIAVPCVGHTQFVQPHMIFYIRSKNHKTEVYCADAVIQSTASISALNALLPEDFCPIHRCYTVNARYVASIRRYEVALVTGEKLPVPNNTYNAVKADLLRRIAGAKET